MGGAAAAFEARQREEEERERQPVHLPEEAPRPDVRRRQQGRRDRPRQPAPPQGFRPPRPVAVQEAPEEAEEEFEAPPLAREEPAERDTEAEQLVTELLDYFLSSMGVVATTYVRDETVDGALAFDIEGEDAGLLIGRRGETLQALQFLVHMIVNRQLGRKAYVVIDVEGYRERRADMLRSLARRTAGRVVSGGSPVALDPMSPADRRIVHMALANHPEVRTESEGEGAHRRVVVFPKR